MVVLALPVRRHPRPSGQMIWHQTRPIGFRGTALLFYAKHEKPKGLYAHAADATLPPGPLYPRGRRRTSTSYRSADIVLNTVDPPVELNAAGGWILCWRCGFLEHLLFRSRFSVRPVHSRKPAFRRPSKMCSRSFGAAFHFCNSTRAEKVGLISKILAKDSPASARPSWPFDAPLSRCVQ